MYILLAMVMLLRGFSDAIMMRSQQALAFRSPGYLPPEHYVCMTKCGRRVVG